MTDALIGNSCGDYASGTNHTLPTYGYAKQYSGVSTLSFLKHITAQELTREGLLALGVRSPCSLASFCVACTDEWWTACRGDVGECRGTGCAQKCRDDSAQGDGGVGVGVVGPYWGTRNLDYNSSHRSRSLVLTSGTLSSRTAERGLSFAS